MNKKGCLQILDRLEKRLRPFSELHLSNLSDFSDYSCSLRILQLLKIFHGNDCASKLEKLAKKDLSALNSGSEFAGNSVSRKTRLLAILDMAKQLRIDMDAQQPAWTRYEGPRGGKGWRSTINPKVIVYQDEMPGEEEHEGKGISKPEATKPEPSRYADFSDDLDRTDAIYGVGTKGLPKELIEQPEKLDSSEKKALSRYTGNWYQVINGPLRWGIVPIWAYGTYKTLRNTFKKIPPLKEPVTVWRGITLSESARNKFLANCERVAKTGEPIQMKGFISTSLRPGVAEGFAQPQFGILGGVSRGLAFEIKAKHGVFISDVADPELQEKEFLLDHASKFKVIGVKRIKLNGIARQVVQLEQILEQPGTNMAQEPNQKPSLGIANKSSKKNVRRFFLDNLDDIVFPGGKLAGEPKVDETKKVAPPEFGVDMAWSPVPSKSKQQKWVGTGSDKGAQARYLPQGQDPNKEKGKATKKVALKKKPGKIVPKILRKKPTISKKIKKDASPTFEPIDKKEFYAQSDKLYNKISNHQKNWVAKVGDNKFAFIAYQNFANKNINKILRSKISPERKSKSLLNENIFESKDAKLKSIVSSRPGEINNFKDIFSIMQRSLTNSPKFPEPITAWRGVSMEPGSKEMKKFLALIMKAKKGGKGLQLPGFQSMSVDPDVAADFSEAAEIKRSIGKGNKVILKIKAKNGGFMDQNFDQGFFGERELIHPHNTAYKVGNVFRNVDFIKPVAGKYEPPGNKYTIIELEQMI